MKRHGFFCRLWPAAAIVAALLCAAARRWQLNTSFEGDLQLPIPGAPAAWALVLLLVVSAAVLLILALKQPVAPGTAPHLAIYAHGSSVFLFAVVCAALLALVAAPVLFRDGWRFWTAYQEIKTTASSDVVPGGNNGLLILVTAGTSALAFFGLIAAAKSAGRSTHKGRQAILLPAINGCLWLMEIYRASAADPVHWNFAPLLLAIAFGIIFYLDVAGLSAGAPAPRRTLWMAGMTVVFSGTALAGDWDLGSALLLASQILAALAVLWIVPRNLKYPPEPVTEAAPAVEEKLEEDTHE